ncbi:MAG: hypothetical protein ACI9VT_000847 [Psychroserpens sp.]|jgi:hypothetical protein
MPVFQYGTTEIELVFKIDEKSANHCVTVERDKKVLLKGPNASPKAQLKLIHYRPRWIKKRIEQVNLLLKERLCSLELLLACLLINYSSLKIRAF